MLTVLNSLLGPVFLAAIDGQRQELPCLAGESVLRMTSERGLMVVLTRDDDDDDDSYSANSNTKDNALW